MNRIPQRNAWDCGVATMAMLLDWTYEQAEAALPYKCGDPVPWADGDKWGVAPPDIVWAGLRAGIPLSMVAPAEGYERAGLLWAPHTSIPDINGLWDFIKGRRAVLTVPNITNPGAVHSVAWDGRYVIDPLYKRHAAGGHVYKADDRPEIFDCIVRLD